MQVNILRYSLLLNVIFIFMVGYTTVSGVSENISQASNDRENIYSSKRKEVVFSNSFEDSIRKNISEIISHEMVTFTGKLESNSKSGNDECLLPGAIGSTGGAGTNGGEENSINIEEQDKNYNESGIIVDEVIEGGFISVETGRSFRDKMKHMSQEQSDEIMSKIFNAFNSGEIDSDSLDEFL